MSDDTVIRAIRRDCVPVALNLYVIREAKGDAGEFFRDVQKQTPDQYQGIYVVSPEGKVLARQAREPAKPKTWTGELQEVLKDGVKAYGTVTPRKLAEFDPQPHRGVGVREDGSVVLAVSARWMYFGVEERGLSKPMFDVVPLTESQVLSLGIAESPKGTTWQVPGAVVQLLHKALSPTSDKGSLPRAHEVTLAELKGKVEKVADGVAYLSYEGKLEGSHLGDLDPNKGKRTFGKVALTGVGSCEVKTGKLLSITLVGDGKFRTYPPYDEERPYGAVIEWCKKK